MSEGVKLPNDKFQGIARAREYNSRGNMADLGRKLATYIAEHENCKDARVLDFGCGTGLVAIPLLEKCKEIELLDPSEGMLAVLEEVFEDCLIIGLVVLHDDVRYLFRPCPGVVDGCVSHVSVA